MVVGHVGIDLSVVCALRVCACVVCVCVCICVCVLMYCMCVYVCWCMYVHCHSDVRVPSTSGLSPQVFPRGMQFCIYESAALTKACQEARNRWESCVVTCL